MKECLRCLGDPPNKMLAAKALINLMENMEVPQAETLTKSLMQCIRSSATRPAGTGSSCALRRVPRDPDLHGGGASCKPRGDQHHQAPGRLEDQRVTQPGVLELALLKSTHKEMVQLGVVIVLRELMNKGDEYIKQQCTLCMANLSASADLRPLMESQGALASLNNIVSTCEVDLTLVQTAKTLLNFACDDTTRSTLLKTTAAGNSVDALVKLFDPSRPDAMVDALCAVSWLSKDRHTWTACSWRASWRR